LSHRIFNATIILILVGMVASSCQPEAEIQAEGTLFIIGGGRRPDHMIDKMVALAGGSDANILVIATASGDPADVGPYQRDQFLAHGAGSARWVHITRDNADNDSTLALFEGVTGIFLSGGDQRRLTKAMNGTRSLELLKWRYREGALIAGTSAGAAVMSKLMITGTELANPDSSRPFGIIKPENIELWEGFGLVDQIIVDQHHIRRKRTNRLFSAVLEHPELMGVGIDESTALLVHSNQSAEVYGDRSILVVDARTADGIKLDQHKNFGVQNLRVHLLLHGDRIDLNTGVVTAHE
jgi:cyanophycinase